MRKLFDAFNTVRCSAILALCLAFLASGCGERLTSLDQQSKRAEDVTLAAVEPGPVAQLLKVTGNGDLFLGDKKSVTLEYKVPEDISGNLQISVDRSSIANVPGAEDILVKISPESVEVTHGMTFTLTMDVETPEEANSFTGKELKVVLDGPRGNSSTTLVPLTVSPVLVIKMYQCEFKNNEKLDACWNRAASIDLRPHAEDIQLRFFNCDPDDEHIIHGNSPIRHGNTQKPIPPATSPTQCSGIHLAIVAGDTVASGTYYMHDTQGSGQARRINFGMVSPLSAKAASAADAFDRVKARKEVHRHFRD